MNPAVTRQPGRSPSGDSTQAVGPGMSDTAIRSTGHRASAADMTHGSSSSLTASALEVSVQAAIVELLRRLRTEDGRPTSW